MRSNDLTDVDLSRLSPVFVGVLTSMMHKAPDVRATIDDVAQHPVVHQLAGMLERSLALTGRDAAPEVLGAICAEADSFLHDVFAAAYPEQASPAAPAFQLDPRQALSPPMFDMAPPALSVAQADSHPAEEDTQMDLD